MVPQAAEEVRLPCIFIFFAVSPFSLQLSSLHWRSIGLTKQAFTRNLLRARTESPAGLKGMHLLCTQDFRKGMQQLLGLSSSSCWTSLEVPLVSEHWCE